MVAIPASERDEKRNEWDLMEEIRGFIRDRDDAVADGAWNAEFIEGPLAEFLQARKKAQEEAVAQLKAEQFEGWRTVFCFSTSVAYNARDLCIVLRFTHARVHTLAAGMWQSDVFARSRVLHVDRVASVVGKS